MALIAARVYDGAIKKSEAIKNSRALDDGTVVGDVTHFSIYAPVLEIPDSGMAFESYAFPNPAVGAQHPTIRATLGTVNSIEITIVDLAGHKVFSTTLDQPIPSGVVSETAFYDFVWNEPKTSGVYYAIIHGKSDTDTIRARVRFAIVK